VGAGLLDAAEYLRAELRDVYGWRWGEEVWIGHIKKIFEKAAWYEKTTPTFAGAITSVRRCLWSSRHFSTSIANDEIGQIPRSLLERLYQFSNG